MEMRDMAAPSRRSRAPLSIGTVLMADKLGARTCSIRSSRTPPGSSGSYRSAQDRAAAPQGCRARHDPPRDRSQPRGLRPSPLQLIVNDYWREALAWAATTSISGRRIWTPTCRPFAKGARLGISTHSEAELAIALGAPPATSPWGRSTDPPQGDEVGAAGPRVADWKKRIGIPAAGGHRRHHAGAGAALPRLGRRHRLRRGRHRQPCAIPIAQTKAWVAATRRKPWSEP